MGYYWNKVLRIHARRMMKKYGVTGLAQESMRVEGKAETVNEKTSALTRQAAAEGCVLLKNDGVLPLSGDKEIAFFGRCQLDWFFVGYGSGGDVNAPYKVSLVDGLENAGVRYNKELLQTYREWTKIKRYAADDGWWGHWPMSYPEMPVSKSLAKKAAERSDTAVVVIGRAAGEDRENRLKKGSYYLTGKEEQMLRTVTETFPKVVLVLNIGNIIDFSWMEKYGNRLAGILIAWQGGMESGNAVCDVLYGKESPSGRLPDTIARQYSDYSSSANFGGKEYNEYQEGIFTGYRHFEKNAKDKVLFPFGYGLSYTEFSVEYRSFQVVAPLNAAAYQNAASREVQFCAHVTNTGKCAGREVVQLWCRLPQNGRLEKAEKVLMGFAKTGLLQPGESEDLTIAAAWHYLASYDEQQSAFILEPGTYAWYLTDQNLPENFREPVCNVQITEEILEEQCERAATLSSAELRQRILERMPGDVGMTGEQGYTMQDVGPKITLRQFVQQLSDEELEALTRGQGMMNSPLGVAGNGGVFGGVIDSLIQKGVRSIVTSDGPAGLRLKTYASLMPCGTAQAATFDSQIVSAIYSCVGEEMVRLGVDVLLGPGMNIHRNPLCGRNFEYFSEDPMLSGQMAAAVVKGVASQGKVACIKHFACNNQEVNRNTNDSRVSERTLREIYLRNFEICVKEAHPRCLMTSYNKVNGVWAHYHYDLVATILRKQWGYDGTVITDWWMQSSNSPEFPALRDNAYRVRSQVDVLMPGDAGHVVSAYVSDGTLLETLGQPHGITRGELVQAAEHVLQLAMYLDRSSRS